MHPDNPLKERVDLLKLCERHRDLRLFVDMSTGRLRTIDPRAYLFFTRAVLEEFFQLQLNVPNDCLVPMVPARLNYLLWLRDLALRQHSLHQPSDAAAIQPSMPPDIADDPKNNAIDGYIIDIGTGANAIFPLLCARIFRHCKVVGVEADQAALRVAQQNVDRNKSIVGDRIVLILNEIAGQDKEDSADKTGAMSSLLRAIDHIAHSSAPTPDEADPKIRFVLCNPPFFGSESEKDATGGRPGASVSREHEMLTPGGEVAFVKGLMLASAARRDRVVWFSSWLGRKSSAVELSDHVRRSYPEMRSLVTTEWLQGKTRRYAIAWSFVDEIDTSSNLMKIDTRQNMGRKRKFHQRRDTDDGVTTHIQG